MLASLAREPKDRAETDPIFIEEKQDDGSVRYRMNERLRKRAEAAVARLSSEKIAHFERQVLEAVQSGRY